MLTFKVILEVAHVPEHGAAVEARARMVSLGIVRPFILFVGTIEPRKNLTGLLKSFAILKTQRVFDGQLVVDGHS